MTPIRLFKRYIGIDYSGAATPTTRLSALRVYTATPNEDPKKIHPPIHEGWNWTRKEVAYWCLEQLIDYGPAIIGIDHCFSFPIRYLERYNITDWDNFLSDFRQHWPTHLNGNRVATLREDNPRIGNNDEFRLTERWTSSARSVFRFDVQGQVAMSSHAGIPWLKFIRDQVGSMVPFWPFDGFEIPPEKSVVAEVYPSIFRHRYPKDNRNGDEQDAYSVARWLKDMDSRRILGRYFKPPLTNEEKDQAKLEGWILGVC